MIYHSLIWVFSKNRQPSSFRCFSIDLYCSCKGWTSAPSKKLRNVWSYLSFLINFWAFFLLNRSWIGFSNCSGYLSIYDKNSSSSVGSSNSQRSSSFNFSTMYLLNAFFPLELAALFMCSRLWIKLPYLYSESSLPSGSINSNYLIMYFLKFVCCISLLWRQSWHQKLEDYMKIIKIEKSFKVYDDWWQEYVIKGGGLMISLLIRWNISVKYLLDIFRLFFMLSFSILFNFLWR